MLRTFIVVSVGSLALVACPGPVVDCRVGADCASGVCLRDGTCGAVVKITAADDSLPKGLKVNRIPWPWTYRLYARFLDEVDGG